MTSIYWPTGGVTVAVEQAIARGESLDWICDNLHVEPSDVDAALARIDAAARLDDHAVDLAVRGNPDVGPTGRVLEAHGTHAAFNRHKERDEQPCDDCRTGERAYQAERGRRSRAARRQVRAA